MKNNSMFVALILGAALLAGNPLNASISSEFQIDASKQSYTVYGQVVQMTYNPSNEGTIVRIAGDRDYFLSLKEDNKTLSAAMGRLAKQLTEPVRDLLLLTAVRAWPNHSAISTLMDAMTSSQQVRISWMDVTLREVLGPRRTHPFASVSVIQSVQISK